MISIKSRQASGINIVGDNAGGGANGVFVGLLNVGYVGVLAVLVLVTHHG